MTTSTRTPSLAEVIRDAMDQRATEIHVALPGKIQTYDSSTQLASVQPSLLRRLTAEDGTVTTERLPVINDVPVIFPRGGGFFMAFPLSQDDDVMLIFCERSLDLWKTRGGEVDPVDSRFHSLQGAVCYPGLYDGTSPIPGSSLPAGKMALGKTGQPLSPAARKDDPVKVTINVVGLAALITAPPGGGTCVGSGTFDATGTITDGSVNVEISS